MDRYSLAHLSDQTLLGNLNLLLARERAITAEVLAHIAEIDARKLYLPAAHPSMASYCIHELGLSEEAAFKRIHAARAARRFPAILTEVAAGRLHLSAVVLLAPHLAGENAAELLAAAAGRTKAEIERLLATRFPRPDLPTRVQPLAPGAEVPSAPDLLDQHAPGRVETPAPADPRPRVAPLAPMRFGLQLTMSQETHDKLRRAQALLGHRVPSGDVAQVLDLALDALITRLEKQKFAATDRPRKAAATTSARHIPAHVMRAVRERDEGRCTFVSETGRRCPAVGRLEYDHVQEVARGGTASVSGIRLRCRAHNQFTAERTFGSEFMQAKREETRARRLARRGRLDAVTPAHVEEVLPALLALGYRAGEADDAAALCADMPGATIEQRVRRALTYFLPRTLARGRAATAWAGG